MHRKSPVKSFKNFRTLCQVKFCQETSQAYIPSLKRGPGIWHSFWQNAPIHTNRHQCTSLSHACSAQHACVTQASPGQQKQRDLQAEPLHFSYGRDIVRLRPHLHFFVAGSSGFGHPQTWNPFRWFQNYPKFFMGYLLNFEVTLPIFSVIVTVSPLAHQF